MSRKITFLGCDPSLSNTAFVYGEIEGDEVIPKGYRLFKTEKTKKKQVRASSDLIDRCRILYDGAKETLEGINPDIIFVETPSGSQNYYSALSYGVSCGLVTLLSPPPIMVDPKELKEATTGSKTATKQEVIDYVEEHFPEFELPRHKHKGEMIITKGEAEHICDALCAVVAGMQTNQYKQIKQFLK